MKYDLEYVCHYLKALVIPQTPGSFAVAEPFRHGLTDVVLHKGIAAFRSFLYALFDLLSANKDKIDAVSGSVYDPYGTTGDHGTASLWHRFPMIRDITYTLFALGMFGHLETAPNTRLTLHGDDMLTAICPLTGKYPEKYNRLKRMNGVRRLEVFRLLSDLGLCFDGADFTTEIDFAKTGTFHVTWDGDDDWALGLKLITEATANHKNYIKMENMFSPVFLRCNFHPLANSVPKTCTNNIREYALAQQPEVQAWIADMDTWLMNHGCTMTNTGSETFTYTRRGTSIT